MNDYEIMSKGRMISFNTIGCAAASEALARSVIYIVQQAESRQRVRKADDQISFERAVDFILGDLFKAYVGDSSPYAYRAEGKTNFYGLPVGHSTWKSIMPVLIDLGYVEYFKGSNYKNPFDEGRYLSGSASRFLATESLISLAESHGINFDTLSEYYITEMPKSVLKLKASKRGELEAKVLPIADTPNTEALAAQVHRLNKYLSLAVLLKAIGDPSTMVNLQVLTGIRVADCTLSAIVISTLAESAEPQCRSTESLWSRSMFQLAICRSIWAKWGIEHQTVLIYTQSMVCLESL